MPACYAEVCLYCRQVHLKVRRGNGADLPGFCKIDLGKTRRPCDNIEVYAIPSVDEVRQTMWRGIVIGLGLAVMIIGLVLWILLIVST